MKKIICSILLMMLTFVFAININYVSANTGFIFYDVLEEYIFNEPYEKITEDLEIYGNIENFDTQDFFNKTEIGEDKIYIHYNTFLKDNLSYDLLVVVKKEGKYYHYEYKANMEDSDEKKEDYLYENIKNYLARNNDLILNDYNITLNEITTYSTSGPNVFVDAVASANYTLDFPKKGYIVVRISVSEYKANDTSSLFIIKVLSSFVPGIVANENGDDSYNKWKNNSGYVHMGVEQAFDRNEEYYYGIRYGSIPYFKDYWPTNNPSTVNITSSYNAGVELGYSEENGFSIGGNIVYGYSKSISYQNPYVNAQMNNNLTKAQWSYSYDENRPWTYDQESNFMYEVSRTGNNMLYGDVRLKLDYQFVVDRGGIYTKKTNNDSLDLMVRIQSSRIYDFNNGMI